MPLRSWILDCAREPRLSSTPSRTLDSSAGYTPFGQLYDKTGSDYSFTGDTSFLASGIYDFPLRRLSASQGRWISPDPAGVSAVDPTNPQSWNRYAYALSNPLALIDPLGLMGNGCVEGANVSGCPPPPPSPENPWATLCDFPSGCYSGPGGGGAGNGPSSPAPNNGPKDACGNTLIYQNGGYEPTSCPMGGPNYKPLVKWYLCGNGVLDNIKNYTLEGTTKGALVGGLAGSEGGPAGVAIGALAGGVEGFFSGAYIGTVAAGICQAVGAY